MDQGKMPHLERLVNQGSIAHVATLHPPLSPMLWMSITTGKRPFKHGIRGFSEPTADGLDVQPVTNLARRCKAVWNILGQEGLKSTVIGWWPSHPTEPINGVMVSDQYHRARGESGAEWPMSPGTVHPPELADTLAELRLHWQEVARNMIEPFVPNARGFDQSKEQRLGALARTLAECVSIHSAATWLIENEPWDLFAVYYDAIDHFCHGYMRYHPPRQDHNSQADFDRLPIYDQMLGALLSKIDDNVTIILASDHGFHPDHMRPKIIPNIPAGPAIEHRDFGVLVMKGPGIKQDKLLHGDSILDIAPTLVEAFDSPATAATIPSWEDVPGEDGRHPPACG